MITRKCYRCKEIKDLNKFPKHNGKPYGKAYICKPCAVEKQQGLYTKQETKVKNRKANLKRKYNLTLEGYDDILKNQNYSCKICSDENDLVVDHCHDTGSVRGILCRKCNSGLGMFKDDKILLQNATDYLNG